MCFPPFRKQFLLAMLVFSFFTVQSFAASEVNVTGVKSSDSLAAFEADESEEDNNRVNRDKEKAESPAVNQTIDAFELPEVEVVSTTPVGATGLERKKISGNVQSVEDEEINRHESFAISDFMNRRLESVNINDVQNNPYQPDVTYRGFTASPLVGTPIGLSVYVDGVRINEAFGDTVNWDLIPQMAVANMELIPGSNPLFGLNTLGGAISLKTKSGNSHPGLSAQAYGGAYGRQAYQAEIGGSNGKFDWYFAGNIFDDGGWRPFSPTSVNQGFGKIGWQGEKTDLDLSLTYAGNSLQGIGPIPQEMLQQNWASNYTAPDIMKNTMYFVNLKGSHRFTDYLQLSGVAYNRNNDNSSLNSNTNNNCNSLADCSVLNSLTNPPGSFTFTRTRQNGTGTNLQLTSDYKIYAHENQFVTGGGFNYSKSNFYDGQNLAIFTPNFYELSVTPYTPQVQLNGENAYSNVFATDTFSVYDWLHVNAAVNWIQAQITNIDLLNQASSANYLGSTTHYQRLNPSAGFTVNPFDALGLKSWMKEFTTYFNYNEGFRAPTPIEMGCSNPSVPCSLPNAMASDPPTLKAVVSHTLEAGMRGKFSEALKWNFALYQTISDNDILYLSATGSNINGYFANVDRTRRQGLEMGLSGLALDSLNWYLSYGYVDATYQSYATLNNAYGAENVVPGNKIPSIPQNTLKAGAEYEVYKDVFLGSDMQYVSSQYARGDDWNIAQQVPDYAILNLNGRYKLTKNIELFAMGRNVLDNHYISFAQMGNSFFTGNATQFQGPGGVATGYAGIRLHWD